MSFTDKRLCNPTQLTTSGQTLYIVPSSKTAIIKQIVVTNITGSLANFSLYIGAAATPNALFSSTTVAANDTIIINLSQVLNSADILTALASADNSLNITISGIENDGPLNPLSTYIADSAITTAKLSDSSITTAKIANNAVTQSKLDSSLSGITVTTSSLRSTTVPSPFEGQMIYETDTDMLAIWNGSAWRYIAATTPTNGTVLQVQSSVYTTQVLMGTSYGDTGLSVSITPKSNNSKILVNVSAAYYNSGGKGSVRILRGATQIAETNPMGADSQNPSSYFSMMYLDSPTTTSALIYKVQAKTDNGGFYFAHTSRTNTLTVMEIAG